MSASAEVLRPSWRSRAAVAAGAADRHRRQLTFRAALRHSRHVRWLRLALPIAGAAAMLALIALTRLGLPENLDLSVARLSVTRNSIIMDNPHLTGFDADDREYSVRADRAVQSLMSADRVSLEKIRAELKVPGQGEAVITANAGDYDNGESTLRLNGGIAVDSSEGYSLRMTDADIDLRGGTMRSANPVSIRYQDSETAGQSISVTGGGRVIVLEGRVRTTLMPPKRGERAADAAEE